MYEKQLRHTRNQGNENPDEKIPFEMSDSIRVWQSGGETGKPRPCWGGRGGKCGVNAIATLDEVKLDPGEIDKIPFDSGCVSMKVSHKVHQEAGTRGSLRPLR